MKPSGKDRSVKNGYSKISGPSLDKAVFEGNLVEARNGVVVNGVGCELTVDTVTKITHYLGTFKEPVGGAWRWI